MYHLEYNGYISHYEKLMTDGGTGQVEVQLEKNVVVTSAISSEHYLITGSNNGLVSVRHIHDGKLIHHLNLPKNIKDDKGGEISRRFLLCKGGIVSMNKRITCLLKSDRLVFAGTADSHVYVYDFYTPNVVNPLAELFIKNYTIRSMIIGKKGRENKIDWKGENAMAFFLVTKKKDEDEPSKMSSIVTWSPLLMLPFESPGTLRKTVFVN